VDWTIAGAVLGFIALVVAVAFGAYGVRAHMEERTAAQRGFAGIDGKLDRIAEYLDGLPQASQDIRQPFERGRALQRQHSYREAIVQYEACLQPGATASQRASLHILIGNCFWRMGELEEADGHYRQAETAATEAADFKALAQAVTNMGIIYLERGDLRKARKHHKRALRDCRKADLRATEAIVLANLGTAYLAAGRPEDALKHLERSVALHRESGDHEGEANALGNTGVAYFQKGDLHGALDYQGQALMIDMEIGNAEGVASDLGNLGNITLAAGDWDKALDLYWGALQVERRIGRRFGEAHSLSNIGLSYWRKGCASHALENLRLALAIYEDMGAETHAKRTRRIIRDVQLGAKDGAPSGDATRPG